MNRIEAVLQAIRACRDLSEPDLVRLYNATTAALGAMLAPVVGSDPVLAVQLIASEDLEANDYNPNHVATPEMQLLEDSIRADGVTMPVVAIRKDNLGHMVTVDGFHRQIILRDRLGRRYTPCSIIKADYGNRMASTIRHNRARGKHQIDLMAEIVKKLLHEGWDDEAIAQHLGMSIEELLRLKQIVGVARLLAAERYSASYGRDDEPDLVD